MQEKSSHHEADVHPGSNLAQHALHTALSCLGQADQSCMPLLPVRRLQKLGQGCLSQGQEPCAPKSQGQTVQALLTKLKQLPLLLRFMLVIVPAVPIWLILDNASQQSAFHWHKLVSTLLQAFAVIYREHCQCCSVHRMLSASFHGLSILAFQGLCRKVAHRSKHVVDNLSIGP